jgi:hypothetical protein
LIGTPVYRSYDKVPEDFVGVLVTDLKTPEESFKAISDQLGKKRVVAPALLGISLRKSASEQDWSVGRAMSDAPEGR